MKMGLTVILIGHVSFMLAALVQGVVLRHINFQKHQRALEYAISTVVTLTSGLLGIIVGILTIVLAKNKKSKCLTWTVFVFSLTAALLAGLSALGLFIAVVMAIKHHGRTLLSHCRFPDAIGYSSVTNECPFDPTRIYSTTLILWVPLIVTSVVQVVFLSRCFAVCITFLGLPPCCCCPHKKGSKSFARSINVVKPLEADPSHFSPPRTSTLLPPDHPLFSPSQRSSATIPPLPLPPPRGTSRTTSQHSASSAPPLAVYTESPTRLGQSRSHPNEPARIPNNASATSRPPRESWKAPTTRPTSPQYVPRQHKSAPPSERQPLAKPRRERASEVRTNTSTSTRQRQPEEHQLLSRQQTRHQPLERGAMERTSFWI
ncbi:keratinocyte-associated protein 3-like isoform X2 [Boleophthalmus pectinirostris]|nr:keratinocyte-associated protein 3-like isoform X2 [Boleophthalmus pectinirostris]